MRNIKPYELLAKVYDKDWGDFSSSYLRFVEYISDKYEYFPQTVLDIGCGTGSLASELYDLGYKVRGIDLSEAMISAAKSKNPEIEFEVADMTSYVSDRKFDLITCAFDSLNYILEEDKVLEALSNVYSNLSENGYFIFDVNTPALYEEKHFGNIVREIDDVVFRQVLEYDKARKIAVTTFVFENNEKEVHIQKAYTSVDMRRFLNKCGFKILDSFKDFNLSKTDKKAKKIFYITKRK